MNVPVNYAAVAVAGYVVGGLWYGPLFGEAWRKLSKVDELKPTPSVVVIGLVSTFSMSLVLSYSLAYANTFHGTSGVWSGICVGSWAWLGFVSPVTVGSVIYEKKPWTLWLLNHDYWLTSVLVM
jgi:hypothetical protein